MNDFRSIKKNGQLAREACLLENWMSFKINIATKKIFAWLKEYYSKS